MTTTTPATTPADGATMRAAKPLYPDDGGIATPKMKRMICCAICGWPRDTAVHLPALDEPEGAPAYDHEFVDPATRWRRRGRQR